MIGLAVQLAVCALAIVIIAKVLAPFLIASQISLFVMIIICVPSVLAALILLVVLMMLVKMRIVEDIVRIFKPAIMTLTAYTLLGMSICSLHNVLDLIHVQNHLLAGKIR
jgi:hypothetical protein